MTTRQLPAKCEEYLARANALALSCPLGRALYVCNRKLHTWPSRISTTRGQVRAIVDGRPEWVMRPVRTRVSLSVDDVLQRARHETAEKWLAHWNNGGSIYTLELSDEQYRARERRKREARMAEGQLLRLHVRRARRAAKQQERAA
jgi:hypothetical protein